MVFGEGNAARALADVDGANDFERVDVDDRYGVVLFVRYPDFVGCGRACNQQGGEAEAVVCHPVSPMAVQSLSG